MYITASKLYNYHQCKHRVWRDKHGPQEEKDPEPNPFVELLWEKGVLHESKIMKGIGEYEDISKYPTKRRKKKTLDAINSGVELIYQGVIVYDNLRGVPDLLMRTEDGRYIAIDIKSGKGYEGADGDTEDPRKPKIHYALQLCLYTEILERLGFSAGRKGKIIDITGVEVDYDLGSPIGSRRPQTFWENYVEVKDEVSLLLQDKEQNLPASSGICKLCPWYESCKKWVKENNDPTQIFYIGRSFRDTLRKDIGITDVNDLVNINIPRLLGRKSREKSFLKGLGESKLSKAKRRASIYLNGSDPVVYKRIDFPKKEYELFFDIESDPTQDHVYLHGMLESHNNVEKFLPFCAKAVNPEEEKKAWSDFWEYIHSLPKDSYSLYYYGCFEKTTFNQLYEKYPDVVDREELDEFFDSENTIDLYTDVVLKNTDWPLSSYSIKEIAVYLGFKWSDETPSGALSIRWYNDYVKGGDEKILKRILKYNKDDCMATKVVKEGIENIQNNKKL